MDEITHRQMRNESAEVLRRVAGETILVTNNGRPTAVSRSQPHDAPVSALSGVTFGRAASTIAVSDMDRALRFYAGVLGMDVTFTNGDPVGFAIGERDGAELHLTLAPDHHATTHNVARLLVSDAAGLHDRLVANGSPVIERLRDADHGMRGFVFADPDRNRIDVGQRLTRPEPATAAVELGDVEPQLVVGDIAASIRFYARLGFHLAFSYGEPAFYAQVGRDGCNLDLRQGLTASRGRRRRSSSATPTPTCCSSLHRTPAEPVVPAAGATTDRSSCRRDDARRPDQRWPRRVAMMVRGRQHTEGVVAMTNEGPLAGLRVIELSGELGRFAGKILAESGASVARVGHVSSGPAMADTALARRGGVLDWWMEGGKQAIDVDLATAAGAATYRRLAAQADLVIDTSAPGLLAELGLDHTDLVGANPRLVQVSLTPFGRTGPRADWQTSDLVAGAMSGVLSISGTPEQAIGAWGRQNLTFGSLMACICGLAGVYGARESGHGALVDLSLHEVMTSSIENLFFQWWFPDLLPIPQRALRQGSLHWLGAYVVADCKHGACNIAPVPQPAALFEWMAEEGDPEGDELSKMSIEEALAEIPRVMNAIRRFALTKDSGELFHEAQRRHIAFGEVQTIAQVAQNPQYEFRGSFRAVDGAEQVRMPGPFARFHGSPSPAQQPPPATAADVDALLSEWGEVPAAAPTAPERRHDGPTSAGKPLAGLRIVDFTWVLAGPFANRILGDLGADVLKFQSAERATLVNSPDFPYFYVWNRSKRLVSLDMKRPEALEHIRRIIEQSDVLMENFSAGVLDRWGIGYEQVKQWNPEIVYVTMSGPGHEGPWSKVITYAPTIHALCGLTYLSNPADRRDVGPGFSLNDHAAGLCAAVAVLSAIESRRRTGVGQHIDIAQLETGTYLIGPAVLDFLTNGREAHPIGNADPFGQWCPNEVYRCGDQHEVAITCRDDDDWKRLCDVVSWDIADLAGDAGLATAAGRCARAGEIDARLRQWCTSRTADAAAAALQGNGVPAGKVQDGGDLTADPQLVARDFWGSFDHAVFGPRPFDRFPGLWSNTDLQPYVPSGAYIGEANFDVYRDIAGMSEDDIGVAIGDGLFN